MADVPVPKSYESILSDMLSAYAAKLGVNDFNVGGAALSFFEVAALSTARASGDVFQILRDFSVDRATGDALKRLATEYRVTPISAKPASGTVTVTDTSFSKISTKVYSGATPPNIGSVQIKVSDASQFTATGAIYIGRGTSNVEGPISYSLISPVGGYYTIDLSSPTAKFHNVGESVILSQGGNRTIPVNAIVLSPAVGSSSDIKFSVVTSATILDGEVSVSGVPVTAQTPGASGNVPRGAIKEFASAPFSGATVTNSLSFTTGKDNETDDELRVRIKRAIASTGLGTATAIKSAVIGATPSDEQSTVVSDEIVKDVDSATLYIDDGTGYEAKTAGVGLEPLIDSALGGEQYFQLATGGRQAPVAKAFLESTLVAPFDLIGTDTLAVVVGGQTYEHIFSTSDFRSPGGATAYEVTTSINANTAIGFEATTSGGGQYVVIRSRTEGNDSLLVTTPSTSGRDAAVLLGLPSSEAQTLRLYKNKALLSKDGNLASIFSADQQTWSASIVTGDTLILSVDGTDFITYTIADADFIATGLYTSVSKSNSLESWVEVFNAKLTGITATVVGQQIKIVSNLDASNRAQLEIDQTSTLVTKGMFTLAVGLTSQGKASDYTLSRNTAQVKLVTPLVAGDELTAGSLQTEAMVESDEIPSGSITLSPDAHLWILADISGQLISTGVVANTTLAVSKPASNTVRYTSSVASAFANVLAGDYVIIWSDELNANNRIEGRVRAVNAAGNLTADNIDILITAVEYALVVLESGIVFNDGFVMLRSEKAPQKFRVVNGTKTLSQIVQELQLQTSGLTFGTLEDKFITVKTTTMETTGQVLIVTTDAQGQLIGLDSGLSDVSKESLVAFYDSGSQDAQMPLFFHAALASGAAADPIDSFISSAASSITLAGRDPNDLFCSLHPYGAVRDAQPYGEFSQIASISGATVGLTQDSLIRRLRTADRFFLASPIDFGSQDTSVVIVDNDTASKSFEIPFYRRATTNTGMPVNPTQFNAYDIDSGPTTGFSTYFPGFDFSNFKVLMQAKKVLDHSAAEDALLYRSTRWGRSGEKINVGYFYPSSANKSIESTVVVGTTVDVSVYLKSGLASPTSIDATTQWDVSITPNTPVAGIDQVTYTWNSVGTNPALSLSGGEYVNITQQTAFSSGNTGIFRVSTEAGFAPTATSFTVQNKTGVAVTESAKATLVNGAISFYLASNTTAADVNTYVNANLTDYVYSAIVDDSGSTGSGVLTYSTFEDSGFSYQTVQLKDGINWIASSNLSGSPQFIFKNSLVLPSDVGYEFRDGEEIRLIPTTQDQIQRFVSILAVSGLTTVGEVKVSDRGSRLELATQTLGSGGSIQVIGGLGNSYEVPVLDSAIRFDNTYSQISTERISAQGINSDQWFRLQATLAQKKLSSFDSNTSITVVGDSPIVGQSTITLLNRTLTQRYFGLQRQNISLNGLTFRVEKQGNLVCFSWNGSNSTTNYLASAVNFNDIAGGTVNITPVAGTSDAQYAIATGAATFSGLSIGDLVTISLSASPENSGTFLVTGVNSGGTTIQVFNINAVTDTGVAFVAGNFSANVGVSEGDSVIVGAPFASLNQGTYRVIRRYNDSFWIENDSSIEEEVVLTGTSLKFYEYEAAIPGDLFVVTSGALGTSNDGSYPIAQVIDKDNVIVTGTMASVVAANLSGKETSVYVQEDTAYTGYKKVYLVATQPGSAQRTTILFDTNAQYEKINGASGVQLVSINKLSFDTGIKLGLDSYRYNTGLIAEANRIIYGDPRDPVTYPGVGAAGADIFVKEPLTRRVQVSIVVRLNTGIPFSQIVEQVRTNIGSLVNSNPIGQSIAISAIVSTVNSISGVRAVSISSPLYNATNDLIYIAPSEKARIIDPALDVSVSTI